MYLYTLNAQEADAGGLSLRRKTISKNKQLTSILRLFGVEYKLPILELNHIWKFVLTQAFALASERALLNLQLK